MKTYLKPGVISLVTGMLVASLIVAFIDMSSAGLSAVVSSFTFVLPNSIIFGGLPSLFFTVIAIGNMNRSGSSEKEMMSTGLWIGIIVGFVCGLPLYCSHGFM